MFTQSKWKVFSENYKYRYISILGELLSLKKDFFWPNYLKFQSSPFSWLIFLLINFSDFKREKRY